MKTVKEYLLRFAHCPKCDSDELETGESDFLDNELHQEVQCQECLYLWTDIYTLTGAIFN